MKTAVFFPSFDLLRKVLDAGLQSELPGNVFIEQPKISTRDLWRSIEGWKKDPDGTVLLGVAGGRLAEGIDYPDEELEAVVIVGIPYPRPTAKRQALQAYLDRVSDGHGFDFAVRAPAQRAILQACGRMIRSEHDRGLAIILDRRAAQFADALPGLAPIDDLPERPVPSTAAGPAGPGAASAAPTGTSGTAPGPSAPKP